LDQWPPKISQLFARGGDSGALVYNRWTAEVVGIVIAVSESTGYSIICSPEVVSRRLGISF
ncbi:MAG TPA: hypothetical protein VKA28_02480, partial [Candidatus Bathyarchaeia archaeon]|nr:hypothetical protein [Candidatus Bathyarchaeia archaeon]